MTTAAVPRPAAERLGAVRPAEAPRAGLTPLGTRALLHVGAVAAAGASLWLGPRRGVIPDADLAWLLRMMAVLKGALLLIGLAILDWRLRRPAPAAYRAGYLGLAWLAAASVATLWRLSALGTTTLVLHAAGAALIVLACLDREFIPRAR